VLAATASGAATGGALGAGWRAVAGNHEAPWIVARAAGLTSYLLLVALVATGLGLSHPWRAALRRPAPATRLRLHLSLAACTLAFTVLHVVLLATDPYARVGWWGAVLPLGAGYRPVPVTLGVLGLYAGLAAGLTAALAGRLARRLWWPVHKVAAGSLILVWLHAVLAGSDLPALRAGYLGTGLAVGLLAVSRYAARTPADRLAAAEEPERRRLAPR
jgi:hypothetical protein